MKVAQLGDGLAVQLPEDIVAALGLKAGDELDVRVAKDGQLDVVRDDRRAAILARMEAMAVTLPPGWKFDRDEANRRGPG